MEKVVSLESIIETFNLEVINYNETLAKEIVLSAVHKPGAELTGFIFENSTEVDNSIHVFGVEEINYINRLSHGELEERLSNYFSHSFPCIIITGNLAINSFFYELAKKYDKAILRTNTAYELFVKDLRKFLQKELAPEIVVNKFVFLEIFGMGILFTGDRNAVVGTCIELLEKNHRFITDGILNIKKISENELIGENAYSHKKLNKNYFLNISETEKINVVEFFGIGSTRNSKKIDLIVKLEKWSDAVFYDRLGIDSTTQYILGVEIEKLIIPVRKGRNLAIIIETAAMNMRMKKNGRNPAQYFLQETQKLIKENRKKRIGDSDMGFFKALSIDEFQQKFNLDIILGKNKLQNKFITSTNIYKPSLEFSGFYELMEENGEDKLQIITDSEFKYLEMLDENIRIDILDKYMSYDFPGIVLLGIDDIPKYFLDIANKYNQVVLYSPKQYSELYIDMLEYLEIYFAPSITLHGVMIEVYGFGVLLKGKSGIGKSETALELIHRGHRLIADDMVKLTKYPDGRVVGKADKVPYFMEIRGLGIIDIKTLYGLGAVRSSKKVDIIIELKELKEDEYLTKADYTESTISIMDTPFQKVDLYISSGRNAASMVEIATMKLRAKKLGYDAKKEYHLKNRILREIEEVEMEKNQLIMEKRFKDKEVE
jgi:HPr kinase/phosphorylase